MSTLTDKAIQLGYIDEVIKAALKYNEGIQTVIADLDKLTTSIVRLKGSKETLDTAKYELGGNYDLHSQMTPLPDVWEDSIKEIDGKTISITHYVCGLRSKWLDESVMNVRKQLADEIKEMIEYNPISL